MTDKSMKITRILINRYYKEEHDSIDALPPEEREKLKECQSESTDVLSALEPPWRKMESIHYSWLIEPLRDVSEEVLPMLLASLSEGRRKKIAKHLGVSSLEVGPLPKPVAHIMASRLYSLAKFEEIENASFLPKAPLAALLTLSKDELVDLIDCLAMLDVSLEIPQMVDRTKLSTLVDALRPIQQQYLKKVLHYKGKWSPPKLGIESWGGKKEKLLKALHKRGLTRLAIGLTDHNEEWRNYFLHRLDVGRASILKSLVAEGDLGANIGSIQKEIQQVVEFVRQYGEK